MGCGLPPQVAQVGGTTIATQTPCDYGTVHNRGLLTEECDLRNQSNDKEAAAKPNSRRTNGADYLAHISLLSVGSAYWLLTMKHTSAVS